MPNRSHIVAGPKDVLHGSFLCNKGPASILFLFMHRFIQDLGCEHFFVVNYLSIDIASLCFIFIMVGVSGNGMTFVL